jgi:hypothetical protein
MNAAIDNGNGDGAVAASAMACVLRWYEIFETIYSRAEYATLRWRRLLQEAAIIAGISNARFLVCRG